MFKRILTQDQNLQLIQDNIVQALTPLQSIPFAGGKLLENISLTMGQDNLIEHGLGRFPKIYIPANVKVQADIWSPDTASLSNSNWNSKYINLRTDVNCIITVWIN